MRKAEEERWNHEEFVMARGTPWEPIPGRSNIERQVLGCPAMIIVLFAATHVVATLLEQPPRYVENRPQSRQTGPAPTGNVAVRDWYEHHVVIGNDPKQPVLMSARKNNCSSIECHT